MNCIEEYIHEHQTPLHIIQSRAIAFENHHGYLKKFRCRFAKPEILSQKVDDIYKNVSIAHFNILDAFMKKKFDVSECTFTERTVYIRDSQPVLKHYSDYAESHQDNLRDSSNDNNSNKRVLIYRQVVNHVQLENPHIVITEAMSSHIYSCIDAMFATNNISDENDIESYSQSISAYYRDISNRMSKTKLKPITGFKNSTDYLYKVAIAVKNKKSINMPSCNSSRHSKPAVPGKVVHDLKRKLAKTCTINQPTHQEYWRDKSRKKLRRL